MSLMHNPLSINGMRVGDHTQTPAGGGSIDFAVSANFLVGVTGYARLS